MTKRTLGLVRLAGLEVAALIAAPSLWAATSGVWRLAVGVVAVLLQIGILIEAYRILSARREPEPTARPD